MVSYLIFVFLPTFVIDLFCRISVIHFYPMLNPLHNTNGVIVEVDPSCGQLDLVVIICGSMCL